MGYSFTYDPPSDHAESGCGFNNHQMTYVRLIMVEAGTIDGDGLKAALNTPGLETTDETIPARNFLSNGGWRITPEQARFVAARLRQAVAQDVISELLMFFDDAPSSAEVREWVEEFANFNERAATRDGYYVC